MNRNVRRRTKQELINHVRFRSVTLLDGYTFRRGTDLLTGVSYGFAGDGPLNMERDTAFAAEELRTLRFTPETHAAKMRKGHVKY